MDWLIGLVLSMLLIPSLWGLSVVLKKIFGISNKTTRKIIHIGMGLYWIIAMSFFDSTLTALIPPVIYLLLNIISFYFNLVSEIEDENNESVGTIVYPFALIILVIFSYGIIEKPYIGGIGAMIMAIGDGLAALIGMNIKSGIIRKNKTLAGSLTMFTISFVVTLIFSLTYNPSLIVIKLIVIPLIATGAELYSDKGFDDLTISLSVSVIYYLLTLI